MSSAESPIIATPVGHQGARVEIAERPVPAVSGWFGVLALAVCVGGVILAGLNSPKWLWLPLVVFVLIAPSLVIVPPGQTSVVQFFGRYIGTARRSGFWWVAPLTVRRRVSVRVRNFETAKSTYAVDNFVDFISVQAESALRHVAVSHPYDDTTGAGTSLRGSTDVVAGELAREVADRVSIAGLEIVEVRISHLAYAQEIAQAMLRRQQANAVVAARSRIVEGAVGMVEMALSRLNEGGVVALD